HFKVLSKIEFKCTVPQAVYLVIVLVLFASATIAQILFWSNPKFVNSTEYASFIVVCLGSFNILINLILVVIMIGI
ncbi:MAG: hypothetical protein ACK559_17865, partial [bacterium]